MDQLIIALIQNLYHWTKRKWRFYLYNKRGKKNSSFVDYGIALCYENEYEAQYSRDSNGRGEVIMDASSLYRIYSNAKGTYSIEHIRALCVEPQWITFARYICEADNDVFSLTGNYDDNGNIQINICCEIEADPKEDDARLYINGYIQNNLEEKRKQLIQDYINYKKNNPPKIEYNI
jgi:hypothetical protein